MEISAAVDKVPTGEFERLARVAEAAAVAGANRDDLDALVEAWCIDLDIDDDTDEVVLATILALGARAIIAARAARMVRAGA